jgi:hypothetical protein
MTDEVAQQEYNKSVSSVYDKYSVDPKLVVRLRGPRERMCETKRPYIFFNNITHNDYTDIKKYEKQAIESRLKDSESGISKEPKDILDKWEQHKRMIESPPMGRKSKKQSRKRSKKHSYRKNHSRKTRTYRRS